MFTPVKLGLAAAATVAAAVPTSMVLMEGGEPGSRSAEPIAAIRATLDDAATLFGLRDSATGPTLRVPGPTGAGPVVPRREAVALQTPPATDVAARIDAGFDVLRSAPAPAAAGPDTTRAQANLPVVARQPAASEVSVPIDPAPAAERTADGAEPAAVAPPEAASLPVVVDGRMVLPPAPATPVANVVDLPPGVPREPPLPEPVATAPIAVAALALAAPDEPADPAGAALKPIDPAAAPLPKPRPPVEAADKSADKASGELRDLVRREAEAQKIPVKLAEAIVEVESGFDPDRKGADGRLGLTQINLRIARQYGYKGNEKELAEPATNVRWGFKYLAGAHRKAGGDLCRTTMKFHGGHTADKATSEFTAYCNKVKGRMASL